MRCTKEAWLTFYLDWAGCAGLYAGATTPFEVPTFPLDKKV